MRVKRIQRDTVRAQGWKPDPHTVALKDEGEWWGLFDDNNRLVCVTCISDKHGGKYFSEVFTPKEFRGRGYCSTLISCLANKAYPNEVLIAHCLRSSVSCFLRAGFIQYSFRQFKHGDQYFMKREAYNGKTEN